MSNATSSATLINCTFSGNTAVTEGGGIYGNSAASQLTVVNCTFSGNSAGSQGAAVAGDSGGLAMGNCVFWGNSEPSGAQVYVTTNATITYSDVQGGYPGTGNVNVDPLFERTPGPGADHVWGTADDDYGDLRIPACSPVVDAAKNTAIPSGITTDVGGGNRFQDIPTTPDSGSGSAPVVDMGAYEAAPSLAVSAGGPYFAAQGQSVILHARGASDVPDTFTYKWDFNGDGVFDDATGADAVFSNSSNLGTVQVSVRLIDSTSRAVTASATVTVVQPIVYVDSSAPGPVHDGTSWANAYLGLSQALAAALPAQHIDVAQGTYTPTDTTDRTASFRLKSGVGVYGGFAGFERANPDARDVSTFSTILSGDIGTKGKTTDNSYHVVVGSYVDSTAVLDGFTITGGNASGSLSFQNDGGGMFGFSSGASVSNCVFGANSATSGGGAIYGYYSLMSLANSTVSRNFASSGAGIYNSNSAPAVTNCVFMGNVASGSGGAIYNSIPFGTSLSRSIVLDGCVFSGNSAASSGGAILNTNNSAETLTNCTFSGNWAYSGGVLYNNSPSTLINCVLWGNSASNSGSEILNNSSVAATYSDVQGGFTGTANLSSDPTFMRIPGIGADGKWGTADDDYGDLRLLPGSPCIDVGSNAAVPSGLTTDLAGNARIFDFPGANDPGDIVDMGAYEANMQLGALHLTSSQTASLPTGRYSFSSTQLTIDPGGKLNLTDDSIAVDYTTTSPIGAWSAGAYSGLLGLIASGRNSGAWNGSGIYSSTAAANTGETALAVAEACDVLHISGSQTGVWNGQIADATTIFIGYTYMGDATMDGNVNAMDFDALASHFGQTGGGWYNGDFNYDGTVNSTDFVALAGQFGQNLNSAAASSMATSVQTPLAQRPLLFSGSRIDQDSLASLVNLSPPTLT